MLCSLDHSVAFCPKLASSCSYMIVTKTAECAELSSCAARLYKSGMAPVQPAGLYLHLSLTSAGASFCHQPSAYQRALSHLKADIDIAGMCAKLLRFRWHMLV